MLIDSHCHIDFNEFEHDRAAVIAAAQQAGVQQLIVPAVSYAGWSKTEQVCAQFNLALALGLHPVFIAQHQPQHLSALDERLHALTNYTDSTTQPIAVGEIGLDYYLKELDAEKQRAYFRKQLIIAKRHQLPVIIHCRKAHDDCLRILQELEIEGGIIHAFNGSLQQAHKYRELGFLLGFGGMLTFARSRKLHALVEQLPLQAIALETDAPDMTVAQHKGERNSPQWLPLVAEKVAELKNLTTAEVAAATTANVLTTFRLRPPALPT